MGVHVVYRLAGFFAGVENDAVAVFVQAQLLSDLLDGEEHVPRDVGVVFRQSRDTGDVFFRNNQDVYRRDGRNVLEGEEIIVFVHLRAGDFSLDDLAE